MTRATLDYLRYSTAVLLAIAAFGFYEHMLKEGKIEYKLRGY